MGFLGLIVLLATLMVVPVGPAISADPPPALTLLDRIGGASADVAAGNGYAYVGDGYGIVTFDVRGAAPAGLGRIVLPAPVRRLHLDGTTLVAVMGNDQVALVDLRDPALPTLRSTYRGDAAVVDAQVAGNLLALATNVGVETLDISDLRNPEPLDQLTLNGGARNLVITPGRLVVEKLCSGGGGISFSYCIFVIDATDPAALALDGSGVTYESLTLSSFRDARLAVSGDLAVVSGAVCCRFALATGRIAVINLATRELVGGAGWLDEPDPVGNIQPYDVVIVGGAALVSSDVRGFTVFSLSATEPPARLRDVAVPLPLTSLAVQGTQGYVGLADGGLMAINLSDPLQPQPGGFVRLLGPATGVAAAGADRNDLLVASGIGAQAQLTRFRLLPTGGWSADPPVSFPHGNLVAGPANVHALVRGNEPPYSLRLIDASGIATPTLSTALESSLAPQTVAFNLPYLYFSTYEPETEATEPINQIQVARFAADAAPELVISLPVEEIAVALTVEDELLYRLSTTAFEVYDLANPAAPAFLGSVPLPTPAYVAPTLAITDGVAYIGFREGDAERLQVIDARDPANPTLGGVIADDLRISTLLVAGERLFVGGELSNTNIPARYRVRQYDLSDPLVPVLVAEASLYDLPQQIVVSGVGVAVTARDSGVIRLALLNERLWLPLAAR